MLDAGIQAARLVGQGLRVGRIEVAGLGQFLFVGLDQPG